MQQVSVSIMNFDDIEACADRPLSCTNVRFDEILDSLLRQFLWDGVGLSVWNGGGGPETVGPSSSFLRRYQARGNPWGNSGGFATGVCKLDTDLLVLSMGKIDNFGQCLLLLLVPDPGILRSDAALGNNSRGFDDCETGASSENSANLEI